jgi:hypothetical protein
VGSGIGQKGYSRPSEAGYGFPTVFLLTEAVIAHRPDIRAARFCGFSGSPDPRPSPIGTIGSTTVVTVGPLSRNMLALISNYLGFVLG